MCGNAQCFAVAAFHRIRDSFERRRIINAEQLDNLLEQNAIAARVR